MKPSATTLAANQAVLNLVLHEARQGNLNRCRALGVSDSAVEQLLKLSPDGVARLAYATVTWGKFVVDESVLYRLIHDTAHEASLSEIDRAIRLGATSAMMLQCFGVSHSETAWRRRVAGIDGKRGRQRELSHEERDDIWLCWQTVLSDDPQAQPEAHMIQIMDIAEKVSIPLGLVWNEIQAIVNQEV
jgi:Protein of unknown function (DUF2857).